MTDITTIDTGELMTDRQDARNDADICRWALILGVKHYHDGESVQKRLDTNLLCFDKITTELKRRGGGCTQ